MKRASDPVVERAKMLLARIVDAVEEAERAWIVACGAMPLAGIAPDLSYYVADGAAMGANPVAAFRRDPMPNLCVDFNRGKAIAKRLEAYGALRIMEVWAWDDAKPACKMTAYGLKPSGKYVKMTSPTLGITCMTAGELALWVSMGLDLGGRNMTRNLRALLKQRLKK